MFFWKLQVICFAALLVACSPRGHLKPNDEMSCGSQVYSRKVLVKDGGQVVVFDLVSYFKRGNGGWDVETFAGQSTFSVGADQERWLSFTDKAVNGQVSQEECFTRDKVVVLCEVKDVGENMFSSSVGLHTYKKTGGDAICSYEWIAVFELIEGDAGIEVVEKSFSAKSSGALPEGMRVQTNRSFIGLREKIEDEALNIPVPTSNRP